jgi:hypothetical protein
VGATIAAAAQIQIADHLITLGRGREALRGMAATIVATAPSWIILRR